METFFDSINGNDIRRWYKETLLEDYEDIVKVYKNKAGNFNIVVEDNLTQDQYICEIDMFYKDKAFFNMMCKKNEGVIIEGKTYIEAFYNHNKNLISNNIKELTNKYNKSMNKYKKELKELENLTGVNEDIFNY